MEYYINQELAKETMQYSKNYNKQWYDKKMKIPEFRAKRVQQTTKYKQHVKRMAYIKALDELRDMLAGGEPSELLVDKAMERYKIIKRK